MIELAASLKFGLGGNGNAWLGAGWSDPEDGFVWSLGTESLLSVPLLPAEGKLFLELEVAPFIHPPQLPHQGLEVVVNGIALTERDMAFPGTLRMEVPLQAQRGQRQLEIELFHPDATMPLQLGQGADKRRLAIQLRSLTLVRMGPRDKPPIAMGPCSLAGDYRFGGNETTEDMLLEGWHTPEVDFVWAIGPRSTLRLPIERPELAHTLVLDMLPFTVENILPRQRFAIGADGHLLEFVALSRRTCLAYKLPPPRHGKYEVTISFDNIDAAAPRAPEVDDRPLAFMLCSLRLVRGVRHEDPPPEQLPPLVGSIDNGSLLDAVFEAAGEDAATVATGFEALGNACELSLLQRRLAREPTGLLRFSGIHTPNLLDGICSGFWGLGRPDRLHVFPRSEEDVGYEVRDEAYSLRFQTSISSLLVDEVTIKRQMARGMPFLARKLFEDMVLGEKIFVVQRREYMPRPEADAVLACLSLWGDCTVLWVVEEDERAGSTERLGRRLLCGYVYDANNVSAKLDDAWLSVLTNAWIMTRDLRAAEAKEAEEE
jgi:hypothetical protein